MISDGKKRTLEPWNVSLKRSIDSIKTAPEFLELFTHELTA